MDPSKLMLSAEESAMVRNSDWLLTKNIIIQKAVMLLGEAAAGLQIMLQQNPNVPAEVVASSPKIAKGENYKGLPYVMLDYPRLFHRDHVFAFRTMFWWGNFISVTWQMKGKYQEQYSAGIVANHSTLAAANFQVCINEDEWDHDFHNANYKAVDQLSTAEFAVLIRQKPFCKLAVKLPLDTWNVATGRLAEIYQFLFVVMES